MKVKRFYGSKPWRRLRAQVLHEAEYCCERCGGSLHELGSNAHVHHRVPRLEDEDLALERSNMVALCRSCHSAIHLLDRHEQQNANRGALEDGTPRDPNHPWNKKSSGG